MAQLFRDIWWKALRSSLREKVSVSFSVLISFKWHIWYYEFFFGKMPLDKNVNSLSWHIQIYFLHLYAIGHCSIYIYSSISLHTLILFACIRNACE